jgi:hypothetical protein
MPKRLHLLDSIGAIDQRCHDGVIVCGSHGGVSSSGFVLNSAVRPRAVFFNDAGIGKERAGIVALGLLESIGVACATYGHDTARIGDARDGYDFGVVTHINPGAAAAGVRVGQLVHDAVEAIGAD